MRRSNRILYCILALLLIAGALVSCQKNPSPLETVELKPLYWPVGVPLPDANEFLVENDGTVSAHFAQTPHFHDVGVYDLAIILTDQVGNELERTVQFTLMVDDIPPVLSGVKDISAYIGKPVAYKSGVTVTDNSSCAIDLQIDSSKVDLFTLGFYPVTYTATDAAGNKTVVEVDVYVYDYEVTPALLNEKLDPVIDRIISDGMTKEEQCRAVYRYVYNNIKYVSTSNKSDWMRAAYLGLDEGQGDCFTYYALSKAFLDRLGIENMCIQRSAQASASMKETHFWNYVNIGDSENPQWYHFDTTHLRDGVYSGKLVLITEQQLQHYNHMIRNDGGLFYDYDHTGYPRSADRVINNSIILP